METFCGCIVRGMMLRYFAHSVAASFRQRALTKAACYEYSCVMWYKAIEPAPHCSRMLTGLTGKKQ